MGLFSSKGFLFKNAPVFALGYYTNDALTPNANKIIKEAKECLAECKSLVKRAEAELAKLEKMERNMLHLFKTRMEELGEMKMADERYSQEETERSYIRRNGSEEAI
ncbi:PREDICTED: uncharacterized protein LOC104747563 [Camelina sativa]|uniref:Uncharacterized protein LOC104747563 n=1 Tax=Camelina sativa TaxID=90675 RepID=A0ABM0W972_CAMSA|nr:PREDICTED: uncharacterized protein LOC104747563 [Camelina sativa]